MIVKLDLWLVPTDNYYNLSAGCLSSTRQSWQASWDSRTPPSTEPWPTLLAEGIGGRVSHGTVHLPSSQRYHLTANGIRQAAQVLGFETPSDFVRAYPKSREWLTLLIRRMDAVAFRLPPRSVALPRIDGLRSHVEFHRRGRFDATITLHDGRSFGVVRQGLALRRRSRYDRLRAIAQYSHGRRPGTVLILVPSAWELRRAARFCITNRSP